MTANEIAAAIVNGNFTPVELSTISSALSSARDLSRDRQAAEMKATLKVGDKVTLNNLRPKSINGLVVTITDVNRTRAVVQFPTDFRAGRFSGRGGITVPLSNITPATNTAV